MTITEASKFLNVSERTIRRAIKSGELQAEEFTGRHGKEYKINSESLEVFRSRRTSQSIYPEETGKTGTTGQIMSSVLDSGKVGTTRQVVSMENINTFLSNINSFIKSLDNLDAKGRQISNLPDICDIREASIYLGVSPRQVREFIRNGQLRGERLGKGLKISKYSLELFRKKKLGR